MELREIRPDGHTIWNEFVDNHPSATYCHLYEWKLAIERAYKIACPYLALFHDSQVVSVLPTAIIKRPLGKRRAISLAFCSYAGWLIDPICDERVVRDEFLSYFSRCGVSALELREISHADFPHAQEVTFRVALPEDPDDLWNELDSDVRRKIRKAQKTGLAVRWGSDQLEDFYRLYSENMAQLGTPVHSKELLRELHGLLASRMTILSVRWNDRPIAAMLLVKFRDQLSFPWSSSLREFHSSYSNMLLYWEALRYACEKGFREFDFGRSNVNSGGYHFKMQWGGRPIPLKYRTLSTDGTEHQTSSVEFYRGRPAKFFSQAWRFLPSKTSLWLGPKIRKYLP